MERVDPTKVEQYLFGNDTVSMTFGSKGGPVTGPAAEWRIIDERLVIGFFGHEGLREPSSADGFTLISRTPSTIVLRTASGEVKTFKVLRNP
jgi:hypothetical protein